LLIADDQHPGSQAWLQTPFAHTMRAAKFALIALGLLLAAAPLARAEAAEAEVDEKDVIVLTDANFNSTVSTHKFVLVSPAASERHRRPIAGLDRPPPPLRPAGGVLRAVVRPLQGGSPRHSQCRAPTAARRFKLLCACAPCS
jgi:hypothetical protein